LRTAHHSNAKSEGGRPCSVKIYPSPSGAIAQLGERIVRNDEVVGSIPTSSTIVSIIDGCDVVQTCPQKMKNRLIVLRW
jgi:hypothetical protein